MSPTSFSFSISLYGEPTDLFTNFISNFSVQSHYLSKFERNRLIFYPMEKNRGLKQYSISGDLLKHPDSSTINKKKINKFATIFNIISANILGKENSCDFSINIVENPKKYSKAKKLLEINFGTESEALYSSIKNLLELITKK